MANPLPEKKGKPISIWIQTIVWLLLVGLLVLVALGLNKAKNPILKIGSPVPAFELTLFSGYEYSGQGQINSDLIQGKVVVINFWASWCGPCESEAEDIEETWKIYENTDEVVFIGINYVDTEPEARFYLSKYGITYPNGPDIGTQISQIFNRNLGVPETYFIDRDNILRYVKIGPFLSIEEIRETIDMLLGGS